MFCRFCGTKNPDDGNFCIKCGQELVKAKSNEKTLTVIDKQQGGHQAPAPGLINSTKLMFKDIFRYGKYMSRADYWYGTLGLSLIMALLIIVCEVWDSFDIQATDQSVAVFYFIIFIFMTYSISWGLMFISATVRRFHDLGMSGGWCLMLLAPFGNIVILVFMCQPAVLKKNKYRRTKQSKFGKILYRTGLVPVIVICLGLLATKTLDDFVTSQRAYEQQVHQEEKYYQDKIGQYENKS